MFGTFKDSVRIIHNFTYYALGGASVENDKVRLFSAENIIFV